MAKDHKTQSSLQINQSEASRKEKAMKAAHRSIGALTTWESEDKLISKHLLNEGTGDLKPNEGSVCVLHITPVEMKVKEEDLGGYKLNEEVEITIGEGDTVITDLLDRVVMEMREGENSYIKTKLSAEGKKCPDDVPLSEGMKFSVSLRSFNRAADSADLEQDERLERAQDHKDKGTELFQKNRLEFATRRYKKAISYLSDMDKASDKPKDLPGDLSERFHTLKCHCLLNLAACELKREDNNQAIEYCTQALELDPNNVKGLFRRGQAYVALCEHEKAKSDFVKAHNLDKDNKAVKNQLILLERKIKTTQEMYKKMFSG